MRQKYEARDIIDQIIANRWSLTPAEIARLAVLSEQTCLDYQVAAALLGCAPHTLKNTVSATRLKLHEHRTLSPAVNDTFGLVEHFKAMRQAVREELGVPESSPIIVL